MSQASAHRFPLTTMCEKRLWFLKDRGKHKWRYDWPVHEAMFTHQFDHVTCSGGILQYWRLSLPHSTAGFRSQRRSRRIILGL
jgi:hypothetical protein